MGKGIKTREIVKDVKVHDAAVNVGDRMKNIGVKTKDTVSDNINQNQTTKVNLLVPQYIDGVVSSPIM